MSIPMPEKRTELQLSEELLNKFIEQYNKLTEQEKFTLEPIFNKATGGKLSPYNSPQPVAIALVPIIDRETGEYWILGGRRGIAPGYGEVALPGGFFEHHENGNEAAAREVYEELGLKLNPELFMPHHKLLTSSTNNTLAFMIYRQALPLTVEELTAHMNEGATPNETLEIVLLKQNTPLAFSMHEEALKEYFKNAQDIN